MKLPEFKPKRVFLDDVDVPCLYAKVKNSELPKVATRHIAKYKKDPVCTIYLRSVEFPAVSDWQQHILDELFAKEKLAAVIETAMKEFANEPWPGFDVNNSRNHKQFKKHGIAPYMTLSSVVLDDIKKEAIISGRMEWDDIFHESGISIHRTPSGWKFDYDDYLFGYWSEVNRDVSEKQLAGELPTEEPKRGETDTTFLLGDWKFDEKEALLHYKRLKWRTSKIRDVMRLFKGRQVTFSEKELRTVDNPGEQRDEVVRYERRGNVVMIHLRTRTQMNFSCEYRLREGLLINSDGVVLRKV